MTNRLYITNLASTTSEAELRQIFAQAGRVTSLQLETDPRSATRNRYSIIEMENAEMTQAAIAQINRHLLHERRMRIAELDDIGQRDLVIHRTDIFKARKNRMS